MRENCLRRFDLVWRMMVNHAVLVGSRDILVEGYVWTVDQKKPRFRQQKDIIVVDQWRKWPFRMWGKEKESFS